jgi:hypothetical protein
MEMIQGVQIDLISAERLDRLTAMEKVRLILDDVMEGNIVVLEKGLAPDEQSKLIEITMREIAPTGFPASRWRRIRSKRPRPGFSGNFSGGSAPRPG